MGNCNFKAEQEKDSHQRKYLIRAHLGDPSKICTLPPKPNFHPVKCLSTEREDTLVTEGNSD